MFSTKSAIFVVFVVLLHHTLGFQWKDCGEGAFAVQDVALTPESVKPGDTATFHISAESSVQLQDGMVNMLVTYGGLPIWTQNDELCDKTACPISKGQVDVVYKQLFPIITPPGQYVVTLKGTHGEDDLFCVAVTFRVTPAIDVASLKLPGLPQHRKDMF